VARVFEGTPAATSDMKPGDVILDFAGKAVKTPQELQQAVEKMPIGKPQPVTIIRDGKRTTINVTPGEQPADYGLAVHRPPVGPKRADTAGHDRLGLQVGELTAEVAQKLGVKTGRRGSDHGRQGWQPGCPGQPSYHPRDGHRPGPQSACQIGGEYRAAMARQSAGKGVHVTDPHGARHPVHGNPIVPMSRWFAVPVVAGPVWLDLWSAYRLRHV